jgi:hypothetical protein
MRLRAAIRIERGDTGIATTVPFVASLGPTSIIWAIDPVDPKNDNSQQLCIAEITYLKRRPE